MDQQLSAAERAMLLSLARQSLERGVNRQPLDALDLSSLPERLREPGATFVTLTVGGALRGCVGALEAYQPLAEDVREHAVTAALEDYRFPPVLPQEVGRIEIEISRLTSPIPLEYEKPEDLPELLHPGVDGVVLREGLRRATFLPQVWEKLPDSREFLGHLCMKMGVDANYWRFHKLQVFTYKVEEFRE
jgi:AmmeMemoRadiSam system protein A